MNVSIRIRLFFLSLASMLSIAAIAFATIFVSYQAQNQLSIEKLTAIRDVRADQVEDYFDTIASQVETMAENLMVVQAMREFNEEFQALKTRSANTPSRNRSAVDAFLVREFLPRIPQTVRPLNASRLLPSNDAGFELQYRYLASNPNPVGQKDELSSAGVDGYDAVHERYHRVFRSFLRSFGYYDIFLVEPENGTIVYSVFKEADFATELTDGPYAESGIGRVFQRGLSAEAGSSVLIDFDEYLPSYAAPASFISSPVYDGDELLGVLIFQMPIERIISAMTGDQNWIEGGMGLTGETYLLGTDRLLRSEVRPFLENSAGFTNALREELLRGGQATQVENFGTTILQVSVRNLAVDAAVSGQTGSMITENYLERSVLSAFAPLDIPGVRWVLMAEMEVAEATESVRRLILLAGIISLGLLLLLIAAVSLIGRSITKPLGRTVDILKDISEGSGDLTVRIGNPGKDEIGQMSGYFNIFVSKLHDIVAAIKEKAGQAEDLSDTLMASSEESSAAVYQISQNLNSIGEQVNGLDGSIQDTFKAVKGILDTVAALSRVVGTQRSAVDSSSSSTEQMVASIQSVNGIIGNRQQRSIELQRITGEGGEKLESTLEVISRVQQAADKIMEAVSIIQAISDQTNLLAMNAAIEAAHAGDAGRGFSVVADEIRKLSETSRQNSMVISESITESVDLINQAMEAANITGESFTEIQREVELFTQAFGEIAASMAEVSQGSNEILESISSLTEVSNQVNAESTKLSEGASDIEKNISTVRDVSTSVSGSIAEIDTGIREITSSAQELAELGQQNRSYLSTINAEISVFTIDTAGVAEKTSDLSIADEQSSEDEDFADGNTEGTESG